VCVAGGKGHSQTRDLAGVGTIGSVLRVAGRLNVVCDPIGAGAVHGFLAVPSRSTFYRGPIGPRPTGSGVSRFARRGGPGSVWRALLGIC